MRKISRDFLRSSDAIYSTMGAYRDFVATIREQLEQKNISVRSAAIQAGLPVRSVQGILEGHIPSVERAAEVASALNLEFYIGPPRLKPEQKELPEWMDLLVDTLEEHLRRGLREDLREELTRLLREDRVNRSEQAVKMVAEDRPKEGYE